MDLTNKTALVTGASSGLGSSFARQLAQRGANLVIVARREDRLKELAQDIERQHRVKVTVLPQDLSKEGAAESLHAATEGANTAVDVLINNAGFGTQERFVDIPWERTREQIQLNITTVTEMTWRFLRSMAARRSGAIMNVASIGAYLPSPDYAAYSASKAYVRDFTEAVAFEMRTSGVTLSALCPGLTETEFHHVAGHALNGMVKTQMMSADDCVRIGLDGLFAGRTTIVPGVANRAQMFMLRFLPRKTMARVASLAAGKH